ncbi:hypothetical protein BU26DRAFT_325460 [Trematosphaeria pertusa]|uniref:Uncharacterized protein n=1 Tax=Trematosphaeria pertusa TaxID=390896 RepID=A0A6A6ICN4_9PLEO|nr:uncharacterized protein BU26DRAFT_325460 [Trematosphaeria pertusa]KAF2247999.1 hypothetical protein BU26DRAFT_325460 [Trematosphaeria pertusa]
MISQRRTAHGSRCYLFPGGWLHDPKSFSAATSKLRLFLFTRSSRLDLFSSRRLRDSNTGRHRDDMDIGWSPRSPFPLDCLLLNWM